MAQIVGKYAAKKMLSKQMNKNKDKDVAGQYDPYYCLVPNPSRPGKMKKVKRQIPDYIPEEDAVILAKMRQRAYWLDMSLFNLAGIRFGWSSVIGIIPGFGDAIDGALALLLYWRCSKVSCGLGSRVTMLMMFNIVIDFVLGLIPIIGDIADAAIRANSKNVRLLEERLDEVYKPKHERGSGHDRDYPMSPATVYEDFSDEEALPSHNVPQRKSSRRDGREPRAPEPVKVRTDPRGGDRPERHSSKRSTNKLSRGSRRERRPDVEMAEAR